MKRLISALLIMLLGAACAVAELPQPEMSGQEMIIGERTGDYYAEVKLYYESGNGMELTGITRNVYVPAGGSLVNAALYELFALGDDQDFISAMPGDASIRSIQFGCGVVTVDLTVNMAGLKDEGELVAMYMAVANTLAGIDGVEYVNILINSRSESICTLPVGALSYDETAASTRWSMLQAEYDNFNASDNDFSMTRDVVLYFPSVNGQWILPEVRRITFSDTSYIEQLLSALMDGPEWGSAYSGFISSGANILANMPSVYVAANGERILEIPFSGIVRDYLILQDIPEWQFAASVVMTMTSFVPEIDAVKISMDGEVVTKLNIKGNFKTFDDGIMKRDTFNMYVGSVSTLYFCGESGELCAVQRAMSSGRALSPYAIMTQLIAGPSSTDVDAIRTMPAGVTSGDLLGVSVADGIATVNMSADFYRLCQTLSPEEERNLVYSIVNTLCELPDVYAVSFRIEGERVDTLAGTIYIFDYLLPNPGIIQ